METLSITATSATRLTFSYAAQSAPAPEEPAPEPSSPEPAGGMVRRLKTIEHAVRDGLKGLDRSLLESAPDRETARAWHRELKRMNKDFRGELKEIRHRHHRHESTDSENREEAEGAQSTAFTIAVETYTRVQLSLGSSAPQDGGISVSG